MGDNNHSIAVLIPTYNENQTIQKVIANFKSQPLVDSVTVIDGGSTDGTISTVKRSPADLIMQTGSGKGNAVIQGLSEIDADICVLVDGDATYEASHLSRLVTPIIQDGADHVIANRFTDLQEGAISSVNKIGNRLFNTIFKSLHGEDLRDILTGYRAFDMTTFDITALSAPGFGIEADICTVCIQQGLDVRVVPSSYYKRPAGSEPKLRPIQDGARILYTVLGSPLRKHTETVGTE